jgi:hypothetical protein
VQVWSADAKPVTVFGGVTDDAARVAYVPLTHSYWLPDRLGNIQAYDARTPALVTQFVEEGNDLAGHGVASLWVPPHCDSVFAATADNGVIQWQCARLLYTTCALVAA